MLRVFGSPGLAFTLTAVCGGIAGVHLFLDNPRVWIPYTLATVAGFGLSCVTWQYRHEVRS